MAHSDHCTADFADVIGLMLAAGGPTDFRVWAMYPLHKAVGALLTDPDGPFQAVDLDTLEVADIGLAVVGVAGGLRDLLYSGVLEVEPGAGGPRFTTDADRLKGARRQLMRMDPPTAAAYRRVALAWRTSDSSLEKMIAKSFHAAAADADLTPPNRGIARNGPPALTC